MCCSLRAMHGFGYQSTFRILEVFVLRRFLCIEEAHERAVGYKRNNPVGFVVEILQPAYPYEYD